MFARPARAAAPNPHAADKSEACARPPPVEAATPRPHSSATTFRGAPMSDALDLLHRIFGHTAFRGEQARIVDHVAGGGDALVLMPTGGGKSLCYQIPALLRDGVGVVISPLIALMQDQVDALAEVGVRAAFVNSTQTFDEAMQT